MNIRKDDNSTTNMNIKQFQHRSGPVNVGYIGASNTCLWVGPGQAKFHPRYFAIGAKNKNLAGRSGIRVLVVGLSLIRALKKTCPAHLSFKFLHAELCWVGSCCGIGTYWNEHMYRERHTSRFKSTGCTQKFQDLNFLHLFVALLRGDICSMELSRNHFSVK